MQNNNQTNVPAEGVQAPVNPAVAQIDIQLNLLVQEHQELTARGQEYAQVIENINVRRHEIKGAVDTLNALKGAITGPQNVEEALQMGYEPSDIETCGPDGMKPYACEGGTCTGECCEGEGIGNGECNGGDSE